MRAMGLLGLLLAATIGIANASTCSWRVFYPPSPSQTFSILNSVVAFGTSDVWAAGYWTDNTGHLANQVFRFDGVKWRQERAPGKAYTIEAMTGSSDTDLWVVGMVNDERPSALHWDGTRWTPYNLGSGNGELSSVVEVGKPYVWAAGSIDHGPLIMHFDGTAWVQDTIYTPPINSYLLAVAGTSPSNLWAGGTGSPSFGSLIEQRNASQDDWSQVPNTGTYIDSISARTKKDAWAVGPLSGGGPFVEHWDGQQWSHFSYPRTSGFLTGVNATGRSGYTWVTGFYDNSGMRTAWIDRYRAGAWEDTHAVEAGTYVTVFNTLASVPGSSNEWAVGFFSSKNTYDLFDVAERWTCPAAAE